LDGYALLVHHIYGSSDYCRDLRRKRRLIEL
jgi:hypothetical protein